MNKGGFDFIKQVNVAYKKCDQKTEISESSIMETLMRMGFEKRLFEPNSVSEFRSLADAAIKLSRLRALKLDTKKIDEIINEWDEESQPLLDPIVSAVFPHLKPSDQEKLMLELEEKINDVSLEDSDRQLLTQRRDALKELAKRSDNAATRIEVK